MKRPDDLERVLAARWADVLKHVEDAVLVLDHERSLRFLNAPARRLLGYTEDQPIGGRCRLTTKGVDCENACPLTFALETDLERVEGFATVYRTSDGRPVPLNVTVIPLKDDAGGFLGAVEILRPAEPDPGFYLAGPSAVACDLRDRLRRHGEVPGHLVLVGERPACRDVARAVHRFAGLPEELFRHWDGSWTDIPLWPPGTMYAEGVSAAVALATDPPEGWRVIVGVGSLDELGPDGGPIDRVVELPSVRERRDDLALMVTAWAEALSPGTAITPDALQRLCRLACGVGLEGLERALVTAAAAADGRIDEDHVPSDGYGSHLVDELLQTDNPLAALEGHLLTEVLHRSGWRMQEAADRLGMSRVTLWRKLKDHGIERPDCAGES